MSCAYIYIHKSYYTCSLYTDTDGTLHHIGEGFRRMSHAHPHHESGHTHNGTRRTSVPNLDLDEEGNPTHSDNQFKRVSSAPLLEMSDIVSAGPLYCVCACILINTEFLRCIIFAD